MEHMIGLMPHRSNNSRMEMALKLGSMSWTIRHRSRVEFLGQCRNQSMKLRLAHMIRIRELMVHSMSMKRMEMVHILGDMILLMVPNSRAE